MHSPGIPQPPLISWTKRCSEDIAGLLPPLMMTCRRFDRMHDSQLCSKGRVNEEWIDRRARWSAANRRDHVLVVGAAATGCTDRCTIVYGADRRTRDVRGRRGR